MGLFKKLFKAATAPISQPVKAATNTLSPKKAIVASLNPMKAAAEKVGIAQKPSLDLLNPLDPLNIIPDKYDLGTMINKKLGINSAGTQDAPVSEPVEGATPDAILGDKKRRAGLSAAGKRFGALKIEKKGILGG